MSVATPTPLKLGDVAAGTSKRTPPHPGHRFSPPGPPTVAELDQLVSTPDPAMPIGPVITDATSGLTGLCAVLVAVAGTAAVLAACVQRPEGSVRLRGDAQLVE